MSSFWRLGILLLFLSTQAAKAQNVDEKNLNAEQEATAYEVANSEYFLIEANKFALLEDYEKAVVNLDKAIELDKTNHAAFFKKAEILTLLEKYDEASDAIETAIELRKDNKYYYVLAAEVKQKQEDPEAIANLYSLMVEYTEGWEVYSETIINAYTNNGQSEEALNLIGPLMVYYPNHPELWLKKAQLEFGLGLSKDGQSTLEEAFGKFPEDPTILKAYITTLISSGQIEKVEEVLTARAEYDYKARVLYMDFLTTQNQYADLPEMVLDNFSDENADLETKLISIGYLLEAPEPNIQFIDSLQQNLVASYPDQAIVFENGGFVYSKIAERSSGENRTDYEVKAIQSFKAAATLNPNNFDAWLKVFEYEIEQAQWEELLNDVEYLVDLYPNQALIYYYYAEAYRGLGDTDEAMALVDQGLRMSSRNELLKSLLLSEKAKIMVIQGETDLADETFNLALRTSNVDERAIYAYAEWLLDVNAGASIELMDIFSNALSQSPKWIVLKAKAFVAQEMFEEAKTTFENYMRDDSSNSTGQLCELYGDVLFQLGETELALAQWQKALTLGGFSEKLKDKIANKSIN